MTNIRGDVLSMPRSAESALWRAEVKVPIRIGFVNTHPVQYFAPLYRYLCASGRFAVSAIYLSDFSIRGADDRAFGQKVKWDVDLLSGYDARFIAGADRRGEPGGLFSVLAPQVWGEVRRCRFDALVVHGHTPAALLVAAAAARADGMPVFTRGETHLGLSRSLLKRAVRQPLMRALYRSFNACLAIGSANAEFYRAMGVPAERIFLVPYTVDNARFEAASRLTAAERVRIRAELGSPDERPIVLYAAKLQARKRPDDLLKAAALLRQRGMSFHLAMIGSGEMERDLRTLAGELGLSDVCFYGFVNQRQLPKVYGASDVFVLPSENEPWGLAVNEAMCAGLPVVAAAEIGCARDLIHRGVNGFTFRSGQVPELAEALASILSNPALRHEMGAASRSIISRWSYAHCAEGLEQAVRAQQRRH